MTTQRDLFDSGFVANIGASAFTIWNAIKAHADFNTGQAYPGLRKLARITGMGTSTAQRAVDLLEENNLLRVVKPATARRGQTYIAMERIEVKANNLLLCTVVMDYVPVQVNPTLKKIRHGMENNGRIDSTLVQIIPGPGFVFDAETGRFSSELPHSSISMPLKKDRHRARRALEMPVDN